MEFHLKYKFYFPDFNICNMFVYIDQENYKLKLNLFTIRK